MTGAADDPDIARAPGQRDDATGFVIRTLGRTDYERCWRAMQAWTAQRRDDTPDELWITEHPPIYTLGLAGRRDHLLRANPIPVIKVDRGGQVTYHGPGQLVVYVLVDLARRRLGIRELVRRLEGAMVEWLDSSGISAYGKPSAPGVYVSRDGVEAKIAALGLKVRNGRTYHGIAVNVAMDLSPFADIDPCGFPGLAVTQVSDQGVATSVERAGGTFAPILARTIARPRP
ncbi:MAG: lipoyl(octanoyl) transferase LipB [Betaproteobacteria bacterium]